jgi:hypothetical protein
MQRGHPDGAARILVSIPAVSLSDIELPRGFVTEPCSFPSGTRNLDVFKHELEGVSPDGAWMLNVPNFPLEERGATGVAGPGHPSSELFVPPELEESLSDVAGKYDKWRPYPASSASNYAKKMALRFARKRCKVFLHAARQMEWEVLFYVEHSPASIAHLDRDAAAKAAQIVVSSVDKAMADLPGVPLVLFSPYGAGEDDGFVVSNRVEDKNSWVFIREFLNGEWEP